MREKHDNDHGGTRLTEGAAVSVSATASTASHVAPRYAAIGRGFSGATDDLAEAESWVANNRSGAVYERIDPLDRRMPQWAILGIGVEAWVDLNQAERDGIARKLRDTSSALIRWSTLRVVMNVLRAIKIQDFIRAKRKTRKKVGTGNQESESGASGSVPSEAQK